jgi:hypothetical protein
MRSNTGFFIFILLFTLIIVVYYVGASTNFLTFANGSRTILYALSGRNAAGNYPGYPRDPGGLV